MLAMCYMIAWEPQDDGYATKGLYNLRLWSKSHVLRMLILMTEEGNVCWDGSATFHTHWSTSNNTDRHNSCLACKSSARC